jgi:hypothetical protein
MTTEQATAKLAEIYRTGEADSKAERAAETRLWEAVLHAEACDWLKAGYCLDGAYHAFGAEPPDGAVEMWDDGKHPIQIEAERKHQEITSMD